MLKRKSKRNLIKMSNRSDNTKMKYNVVDLFSGAGGMSFGFKKHDLFNVIAAADVEYGKPSSGKGKLQCNKTYEKNIGITPKCIDLSTIKREEIKIHLGISEKTKINVLCTCPPCTGFSRANPRNHIVDDKRNSLVRKSAEFAIELDSDIVIMENARELIRGNFKHHYEWFREYLEANGYDVFGKNYMLTEFGLPQIRERAIIIATKSNLPLYNLDSLWDGWTINDIAITVKRAFNSIAANSTGTSIFPKFSSEEVIQRISAIPKNGGSWVDFLKLPNGEKYLTPSMKKTVENNKIGSYPDVYGRMAWEKPAPTIKRECSHVGNGRYSHPEENRLCSVREMASLQGFPNDFIFEDAAVSNLYRHIGDAVPPLISYQLAHLCSWMLSNIQPEIKDILLKDTNLSASDIVRKSGSESLNG